MTRLQWYALLFLLVSMTAPGCRKIDELTQFTYQADHVITVNASPLSTLPVSVVTPDMTTSSESAFGANDTRKDLIEHIVLRGLELRVQQPDNGNLQFLKSISVFIVAGDLPEVRVAYKDNVPANVGAVLQLDVTGEDLVEYIREDSYRLRINVITDEAIGEQHEILVHGTFSVDAKILGQ